MSEFHVEVVRIDKIGKHPNADALEITHVRGQYPVIVKLGQFREGDLAVHVPVDAIMSPDDSQWDFLDGHYHIKAKKIRGILSLGMLVPANPAWVEGEDYLLMKTRR